MYMNPPRPFAMMITPPPRRIDLHLSHSFAAPQAHGQHAGPAPPPHCCPPHCVSDQMPTSPSPLSPKALSCPCRTSTHETSQHSAMKRQQPTYTQTHVVDIPRRPLRRLAICCRAGYTHSLDNSTAYRQLPTACCFEGGPVPIHPW